MKNIYVCEIVATRLSHDLIGNIGAVANAVELLHEGDDEDKADILPILDFSSTVLSRRLKFFRLCFGLSNSSVKNMTDLQEIIQDYLLTLGNPNYPIRLSLKIETPQIYKLIMPAIMMMADVLVKGGEVLVEQKLHGLHISALSEVPLNQSKLQNIDLVLSGQEIEENPSTYAPLYYLLDYLSGQNVPVSRKNNTLVIGE
ncbi:MAG: hypothetical protein IJ864_01040 [Alphaproteobacteria bacterium]|nr:hypothetical protein [Alphaproteobacteria bacterium]